MPPTLRAIMYDLDGTLTESKQPLDTEMAELLAELLQRYYVLIISGGSFEQFKKQFLEHLHIPEASKERLILLPTTGAALYRYKNDWYPVYEERMTTDEVSKITEAFRSIVPPQQSIDLDDQLEYRGTQVTFSGLGQFALLEQKRVWDPRQEKRREMIRKLQPLLPDFQLNMGGMTSIDVTRKGVDKAYGIRKASAYLHIPPEDMLFVGDALYEGGNDAPAKTTGIVCTAVASVAETKILNRQLLHYKQV